MMAPLPRWLQGMRKYENVRHPYPELSSFSDTDRDRSLFFGREREAEELLNNLLTSDVVLFFGRSGYGKTSLINAGVMEPLRKHNYFPVVFQLTQSMEETPLEHIRSRMLEAAKRAGVEVQAPPGDRSLWEYFQRVTFRKGQRRLRPVLILDQFEQLFSRVAVQPQWQRQFIQELSDLIRRRVPQNLKAAYIEEVEHLPVESEERRRLVDTLYGSGGPDVKVLIAIREAFLPELEALRPQVPAIFSNAVRLEPLTAECARLAITQPAAHAALVNMEPFGFEERALDELIAFLSLDQRTGKPRAGACIEPAQLQILCYHLSVRRLRTGAKVITARDLQGTRGMQRIMRVFYYRLLRQFPRVRLGWSARRWWPSLTNFLLFHRPRKSIRQLCEYELVTASGYRNSLILDSIQGGPGVSKEPRLGTVFFELMHDTLIEPLRKIRRNRRLLRLAVLASFIFVPWAILVVENYLEPLRASQTLGSPAASTGERTNAFQVLIAKEEKKFSNSNLQGVRVRYRSLPNANLRGASLRNAKFNNVDLRGVDLRDVQAQGAEFHNSAFEGAKVAGMNIAGTSFDGSDWWMAVGWSDQQLNVLAQQYSPQIFVKLNRFLARQDELLSAVKNATGTLKGDALYHLAWYRATNGANLIAASLEIEKAMQQGDPAKRFYYLDTRAYIRLQMRQYATAVDDLEEAARLAGLAASDRKPHSVEGAIHYHLALAHEGLKRVAQADKAFAKSEQLGYIPSYERVLTPRLAEQASTRPPSSGQIGKYLKALED
jgi:hypothetical protein